MRNLPKVTWVFIVVLFGPIGAIAWLGFGRPMFAGFRPGDTTSRPVRRALGPEDSETWTHSRPPMAPAPKPRPRTEDLEAKERRLRAWEADLQRREDGPPPADAS